MPYNPGIVDRRGDYWAAGISQAGQGLANGIMAFQRQQEENRALTGTAKALETLLPQYAKAAGVSDEEIQQFLAPNPDESPRAKVARLQTAVEGIIGTAALQSRGLQNQATQTNIAGERQRQAEIDRQVRDSLAQRGRVRAMYGGAPSADEIGAMIKGGARFEDFGPAAGGPPATAQDAVRSALAAGVDDPRLLTAIGKMADAEQFVPQLVDLGDGTTAMLTSRHSAVPVKQPIPKPLKDAQPEYSADGRFYRSSARDAWRPVPNDTSARPFTLNEWMAESGMRGDGSMGKSYTEYRKNYEREQRAYKASLAGPAKGSAPDADEKPVEPTFANAEAVRTAMLNGKLTREQAIKILQEKFGYK